MKPHPIWIFLILLATATLFAPSCKPVQEEIPPVEETPAPEPAAPDVIAAAFSSLDDPFSAAIRQTIQEEATANGFALLAVSADSDAARQRQQVAEFVAMRAKAIVIQPCGPTAIGAALRKANIAGIPVFSLQIECRDPGAEIVSHIGADEIQGGRLAGLALIEAIGESGGEILLIDSRPEDSCVERIRGFREIIERFNASRPVGEARLHIAAEISGNGTRDGGFRALAGALPIHPGIIGIFATGDSAGLGAADALERAGKQDQAAIVTVGHLPEARRAIPDGRIYAAACLSPGDLGRRIVQSIREYLEGREPAARQMADYALCRKDGAGADPDPK